MKKFISKLAILFSVNIQTQALTFQEIYQYQTQGQVLGGEHRWSYWLLEL